MAQRDDPADVAIVEDVWGEPFERLGATLRIGHWPTAWTRPETLPELLAGARALVVRNRTKVTRSLLASLPDLRIVARAGVGLDNIDLAAADDLGVVVSAPRGANAVSVAEHTVGMAIAVARGLVPLDRQVRAGHWPRTAGHELAGRTWGLLGLGATGCAVARLVRALGMDVLAYDPYIDPRDDAVASSGARLAPFEVTVRAADVLSVHLPATPETRGVIGGRVFSWMRRGAILVNVGRGDAVDEDALVEALQRGQLHGAALDVRAAEPPSPGPLNRLDNVVLTPHIAGITVESQRRIAGMLAEDIARVLAREPARHAVGSVRRPRLERR